MKFYNGQVNLKNVDNGKIIKITQVSGDVIDVWLSEETKDITEGQYGRITYRKSVEGIYGSLKSSIIPGEDGNIIEKETFSLYKEIFGFISEHLGYRLVRIWNYVPLILKNMDIAAPDIDIYRCFNSGRYKAFREQYGENMPSWPIPSASAIGSPDNTLAIEFFASNAPSLFFENTAQIPAYQYSLKYGKLPPVFSRGAICELKGETLLLTSGTASVVKEDSVHIGDIRNQIYQSFENIKILSSRANLEKYGLNYEFGIEELVLLRVYYKNKEDRNFIETEINKIISPCCQVSFINTDICRKELIIEIEGIYSKKIQA